MNKKAFTIIELLVVMGIVGLMIPIIFTVLYAVIRQEARIFALTSVKNQGDFILNSIKYNVRNYGLSVHNGNPADDLNRVCTNASATPTAYSPLYLRDRTGNTFYYSVSDGNLASNSSVLASAVTLNSNRVTISNFSMSCNRPTALSAPIVSLSYTVNYVTASGESPASMTYQTKIKLRNR